MKRPIFLLRTALGVSIAIISGQAIAQSTTPPGEEAAAQAADGPAAPTQDVVVTAQRREQLLVDVPQSVSVISGDALDAVQATNFQDYLKLVPGLTLNQATPGFGRLILRGVNTGGVASTVAVYQDETVFGSSTGLTNGGILAGDFDTFDVARIEVLRGPQGTLYGANALGGVLKFVNNQPDTTKIEARGKAAIETTKGGEESYLASAVVNVPLGDKLAVRASGFYRDFGGFIDSIGTNGADNERNINGAKSYGGRGSILFRPSETFSLQLSAYLQNIENQASGVVDADPTTGRTLYGRPTQSQFAPESSRIRYRVYSAVGEIDLGFASLVSVTSYSTQNQRFLSDQTTFLSSLVEGALGVPNELVQLQTTRVRRLTQEVRLQSADSDRFEWQVGGFYTRERGLIDQQFEAREPGTDTAIGGLPLLASATLTARYRELAGFANATIHFGERFDLTFGGRYSHNKQRAGQASDGVLAGGPNVLPEARSSEDVFTYSVAPRFEINDRASIYARVAKGFRPGGPNVLPPGAPADLRSFDSDSLVSYEIGIKAETADRTFGIDLAGFYIDWKDIQVFGIIDNFGLNFNGGKAESRGFEFTATLRPTAGLTASLVGAYTDAKLRDDTPEEVGGLDGDRLPYTPKYSVSVNADYEWSLGGETTAFVGGSLRSLSRQTGSYDIAFRTENGRQRSIRAFETVDLRAGIDFGRFSLEAYAKNLTDSGGKTSFDEPVVEAATGVPLAFSPAGIIRPRTLGVALTAGF